MAPASPEFKELLRSAFAALRVGQSFTFRRTFTDADVSVFCGVSGDYNPYHIDDLFAAQSFYGRRTLPGLLTASMVTHLGGMIGFLATEMSFEFLAPVYIGDTITCTFTIRERDEAKRWVKGDALYTNQDGAEVLFARTSGFPSLMRLAPNVQS